MFKLKSKEAYWQQFSSYQTFQTVKELNETVKRFVATYDLTDAIKAVLNTLKLYSKRFFGVCWLRKEKIALKAKVSMSTVDRAIKGLKESGLLTVIPFNHTKRGGQTHNVYVLNPIFEEAPQEVPNKVADESEKEPSKPYQAKDSDVSASTHKNSHTNPNTSLNHLSIKKHDELKFVPNKFIDLMEPFYANQPDIILDRWKSVCVAAKRSCFGLANASFDTIGKAWDDVMKIYKRGKIRKDDADGIGGYFYTVLSDYLLNDWLRTHICD